MMKHQPTQKEMKPRRHAKGAARQREETQKKIDFFLRVPSMPRRRGIFAAKNLLES